MMTKHAYRRAVFWSCLLGGTLLLGACASAPVPNEQVSLAKEALDRAVSAGATEYAPMAMKTAQDKRALMDRALGEKNYAVAKVLAQQIAVDSALAERTARTAKLQQELIDAQAGIQVLKQEMLQAPDAAMKPAKPLSN